MPVAEGPPLSLRPFPVADKSPKNLADFISRVNALPGGFRAVTEDKLQDEIEARRDSNGDTKDDDDVEMSEQDEGEEEIAAKDPNQARMDMLRNIDIAGNNALLTLDSLSLLLSKQNPTHAGQTLSQHLRDLVGIGTIGSDKLDDSNLTAHKVKEKEEIAVGWTLLEINKTRDSAEEATTFLEAEMDAEGRYWEGVMAVRKAGWSICKVPQARHNLGVRFGFSEAAAELKANGLAVMQRGNDGSVDLDCGHLGATPERIVVTYEKQGRIVGRTVSNDLADSDALEKQVLSARNTIFAQELWREITREARSLAAYNVLPEEKRLTYTVDSETKLIIELVIPEAGLLRDDSLPDNAISDAVSFALHILLTYAHRCNELMRIRLMPPHIPRSRGPQTYTLLRPIIARIMSSQNSQACTEYVGSLVQVLQLAGFNSASFTLYTPWYSSDEQSQLLSNQRSSAITLVRNMLQPIDTTIELNLLPDLSLSIRGRTYLFPVTATYYRVHPVPSSTSNLDDICAPYADGYPDLKALSDYLRTTTARALTKHFLRKLSEESSSDENVTWAQSVQGTSIRDTQGDRADFGFALEDDGTRVTALVMSTTSQEREAREPSDEATVKKQAAKQWKWSAMPSDGNDVAHTPLPTEVVSTIVGQKL